MLIEKTWFEDIPQQFHGKPKIEVLIKAFSRQLDELIKAFDDISNLTLDNATGANLDHIGTILSLTRKDLHSLLSISDEINDELYRRVLKYKALKNTGDGTYEDIMSSISLLWNVDNIVYKEDPAHPATVFIDLPQVSLDDFDPVLSKTLAIKPAGVAMLFTAAYLQALNMSGFEVMENAN